MNNERKDEGSVYSVGSQNNLVPIKSKKTFFKKRTQISNLLVIILCFLAGSLLITVVVLAVLYARSGMMMKICDNENCVRVAASLKESMDKSVDPCDDFYQYACGRWAQEHPIPDFSMTNSWFSERAHRVLRKIREELKVNMSASEVPWAVMQAKTLFTSCMDVHTINELNLSPMFDLLELLNIPLFPGIHNETNYIEQIARIKRILGYDVFFGFDVMSDPKNNSRNVLYLHLPDHSNPFPFINKELEKRLKTIRSRLRKLDDLGEATSSENEDAELTYMTDVIMQVVNNNTFDTCTSEDTITKEDMEGFALALFNISNSLYNIASKNQNYSISIEDLSDNDYMLVDDLQKLTDEYATDHSNVSDIDLKPIWRPFIESIFEGIITLDLDKKDKILIGNLEYLKEIALTLATYDDILLESYTWWVVVDMVVPHSSEKLRHIWYEYVNKLTDVEGGVSQSLICASVVNELMGMAVSRLFVDPTFHSSEGNKVLEMLEDIREAFASLVVQTDWMDQSTKMATLEKSQKMGSEIGFPKWIFDNKILNEYYEGIDDYIDGELTLDENIADNGGLREAIIAYERWKARHGQEPLLPGFTEFTHEQLFFLSFAHLWCESYTPTSLKWMMEDSHCPGHVRLKAALKNSKEFNTVWNCPVGSNMNPSRKCHLW
ncbi:hypothetical protein P5V15_014589 [Pogonomyrmex californicus]